LAIASQDLALIKLFLDKGAAPGDALLEAVEIKNPEIIKVLVEKADRVYSTRALGRAVDQ
jgi:hypothetical protein